MEEHCTKSYLTLYSDDRIGYIFSANKIINSEVTVKVGMEIL